jgi:hypothetical protein
MNSLLTGSLALFLFSLRITDPSSEFKNLVASNDYYWMDKGVDSKIKALRELPQRFAELRLLALSEPELVLAAMDEPKDERTAAFQASAEVELVEV